MKRCGEMLVMLAVLALAGCYHATIETGLPPSSQTVEDNFADAWVYGLVPPKTVETASQCPSGVARVETHLSFVNQLVGFLTLGIYTPMTILVTCAAGDEDVEEVETVQVPAGSQTGSIQSFFGTAADAAVETRTPVLVEFIR